MARLTKRDSHLSFRLSLAVLSFIVLWGTLIGLPFRRVTNATTAWVDHVVTGTCGGDVYAGVLATLTLTGLFVLVVSRVRPLARVATPVALLSLLIIDGYGVATARVHPSVLWPTIGWMALTIVLIVWSPKRVLSWYRLALPAAFVAFWFYDSVVKLLIDLGLRPDLSWFAAPTLSYTYRLSGLLGLPAAAYVVLPLAVFLPIVFTHREAF